MRVELSSPAARSLSRSSRFWQRLQLVVLLIATLVCLVLAVPGLARFVSHSAFVYQFPYPVDGLEGTLLFEARLVRAGEPLYQPLRPDRFISAPYPPLHAVLLAWSEAWPQPHMWANGRLLSLLPALLIGLLAAAIVLRLTRMPLAAVGAGLLWLLFPPVQLWATRIKPDMLALALVALGVWLVVRALSAMHAPNRGLALAAAAFALAFLTKQTAVLGAFACGLALLLDDLLGLRGQERAGYIAWLPLRWRTLRFGALYLGMALGFWGLLDLATAGQYTFHVWGLHRSEWWSLYLFGKFFELALEYWPLAVIGLAALPLALVGDRAVLVPLCYLLVAPVTMAGAGETGAHHNHLLELQLALSLASLTTLARLWYQLRAGMVSRWVLLPAFWGALLLLVLQLQAMREVPQWYRGEYHFPQPPLQARFIELIRSQPGEVLADNPALILAAGKPLRYDDPSTMGPAARSGVWSQDNLIAEIRARRFALLLMPQNIESGESDHTGRWNDEVLAAMGENYRLLYRDKIKVYAPDN